MAGAIGWRRPPHAAWMAVAQVLIVSLGLLAPWARKAGKFGAFVSEFYPLLIDYFLYVEVGLLNVAGGVSHDHTVLRWERALFHGLPSLAWIRAEPSAWASSVLHAAYLSKYLILAVAPLGLWISGRRLGARRTLLLTMVTFYLCYTSFLLFPVAGPRFLFPLATNEAALTPVAVFTRWLLEVGSAWGTAFPSAHVAVALVASVSACLAWPRFGAPMVALVVPLTLGTVYGQFHYAVDAIAGAAVGAFVLVLRRHIWRSLRDDEAATSRRSDAGDRVDSVPHRA